MKTDVIWNVAKNRDENVSKLSTKSVYTICEQIDIMQEKVDSRPNLTQACKPVEPNPKRKPAMPKSVQYGIVTSMNSQISHSFCAQTLE